MNYNPPKGEIASFSESPDSEDVAKRFAVECVNEALGNKIEVSNALHSKIESMYNIICSIVGLVGIIYCSVYG